MPGTVDDFIKRFGGNDTMDDREAAGFLDRFASDRPDDRDFDNETLYEGTSEYLGKLPQREFQDAAQNAYASASPDQQQGLASTLLRALQGRGVSSSSLAGLFGGSVPRQVSPGQYAQLADFARQQHPEAMREVVREQPWFVKAMGNPIVMGALGVIASRMMRKRGQSIGNPASQNSGGLLGRLF